MRENKYDNLLNVSIVILIVSSIMLCVTGYNIFFKKNTSEPSAAQKNTVTKDSLQKVYNTTLKALDNNILIAQAISADNDTKTKLAEMSALRVEIDSLLRTQNPSQDLAMAKLKIEELQFKVKALQDRYSDVATENKKLRELINSLIAGDKTAPSSISDAGHIVSAEKSSSSPAGSAFVSGLHLFAVSDQTSRETSDADLADKIVGSFFLKNISKSADEVMVVVLQPDGKVIKNSVWESGTFETREGKKVYSRKLPLDAGSDEKQLNFSLTPDKFLKGDYTMQVWYNGSMIGKMIKTLS